VCRAVNFRVGVWFQGGVPVVQAAELAHAAEHAGADSVWVAEGLAARDAFVTLAVIAQKTDRVELGTGVVNPYARHPAQLAASFATLDEAAGGRVVCGVGVGARDHLVRLGFDVSHPLAAAREMVELLRRLIARELVDHEGEKFHLEAVRLGFRPQRHEIPVYLAATGPKMCALAGEIADGIYVLYGTPQFLRDTIERSEERRGQDRPFDVACPIQVSVDDDPVVARARIKPGVGLLLTEPNGESVLEANGLDPAHAHRIRDAIKQGGIKALASAVDDEVVERLAIAGTPSHCLAKVENAVECGVSHPQLSLHGDDPRPTFDVLRALKSRRS
jgi:5,10-methylenetetrahydromethanopterin reductase